MASRHLSKRPSDSFRESDGFSPALEERVSKLAVPAGAVVGPWFRWGLAVGTLVGCARGPVTGPVVNSVHLSGAKHLDESDVLEVLATTQPSKILGYAVSPAQAFNSAVLEDDVHRIERFYRAHGFVEAKAKIQGVAEHDGKIDVAFAVDEGPPVVVQGVRVEVQDVLDDAVRASLDERASEAVPVGSRFDEALVSRTELLLSNLLTEQGYAHARVQRRSEVDLSTHRVAISFDVQAGPIRRVGAIHFEGQGELPEGKLRRTLGIQTGEVYRSSTLHEAEQRLMELGVFRRVDIEPVLDAQRDGTTGLPLRVLVAPAPFRTVQLGAGIQLDLLRTDVHGLVGWEHTNWLGGLRHLALKAKPGVVFFPTRLPEFRLPQRLLPMVKLEGDLTQPGFVEGMTTGAVGAEYSASPLLIDAQGDGTGPILGYHVLAGGPRLERRFGPLGLKPSYRLQANFPFTYRGDLTPDARSITISSVDLLTTIDLRDDAIRPRRGVLLSLDLQTAGGILGADASDARIQPEMRVFLSLAEAVSIGLRSTLGFLAPSNYGGAYEAAVRSTSPPPEALAAWSRDIQILTFRGFYSGGATNRGYPSKAIGPYGFIPYLVGDSTQGGRQPCLEGTSSAGNGCLLPLGGLSLWEASLELRWSFYGPLGGVLFCDASNVSPTRFRIDLRRPHLSCGVGFRYATPVGPFRVDLGYRIPGAQALSPASDGGVERAPPDLFGVFPGALALGIGEAF